MPSCRSPFIIPPVGDSSMRNDKLPPHAGCWPTAVQRLFLNAALLEGRPSLDAYHAWHEQVTLDTLAAHDLDAYRLLPLLYHHLTAQGFRSEDAAWQKIKGTFRKNWVKNQIFLQTCSAVLALLQEHGVEPLLLGGVPLAVSRYQQPAARSLESAGVLVDPSQAAAAFAALRAHGWLPNRPQPQSLLDLTHSISFTSPASEVVINISWRLLPGSKEPGADRPLWAAAEQIQIAGTTALALSATDQLLMVCSSGPHWRPVPPITWITDAMQTLRQSAALVDWARLLRLSQVGRLTLPLHLSLTILRDLFAAPIPESFLDDLARTAVTRSEKIAFELAARPPRCWGATRIAQHYLDYRTTLKGHSSALGFPRYLQVKWAVPTLRRLPQKGLEVALKYNRDEEADHTPLNNDKGSVASE